MFVLSPETLCFLINQANVDSLCTIYYQHMINCSTAGLVFISETLQVQGLFLLKAWKITLKIFTREETSGAVFFSSYSKRFTVHGQQNKLTKFSDNWSNLLITFGVERKNCCMFLTNIYFHPSVQSVAHFGFCSRLGKRNWIKRHNTSYHFFPQKLLTKP